MDYWNCCTNATTTNFWDGSNYSYCNAYTDRETVENQMFNVVAEVPYVEISSERIKEVN